jgi:hypothetical protein
MELVELHTYYLNDTNFAHLTQAELVSTNRLRILQFVCVGTQYKLMVEKKTFPISEK